MSSIKEKLWPYRDVLRFLVVFFAANYFWKYTIDGSESGLDVVKWFGYDITLPFAFMAQHIASIVAVVLAWFTEEIWLDEPFTFLFADGNRIAVVWSCTALKQAFIFISVMLFARGSSKHKLWFIPFGLFCTYLFNILRIILIIGIVSIYPASFAFMHEYLFKYLFYGMFFLLWVWWNKTYNENR